MESIKKDLAAAYSYVSHTRELRSITASRIDEHLSTINVLEDSIKEMHRLRDDVKTGLSGRKFRSQTNFKYYDDDIKKVLTKHEELSHRYRSRISGEAQKLVKLRNNHFSKLEDLKKQLENQSLAYTNAKEAYKSLSVSLAEI